MKPVYLLLDPHSRIDTGGYPGGYRSSPVNEEHSVGMYPNSPQYSPYPSAGYAGYGPPGGSQYPRGPKPWYIPWQDNYTQTYLLEDPYERRAFIRKVYSILMVQLLVTAGIISAFIYVHDVQVFVAKYPWIFWVAVGTQTFTVVALSCCTSLRRQVPCNFIFLFIFTIAASVMLGIITSKYNTHTLYMAVGITAAICLALTLFAFQTKWDFTVKGGMLLCCLVVLFIFGKDTLLLLITVKPDKRNFVSCESRFSFRVS
ncbi:protein lifeguard 1-like [Hyposmocoma kahamanoa]|uniref:protein lifeguard 1-like n=1 Tax=Hyposmocoma kahamanoa TaxID=1477025 RepID=UPI000E6DA263|nr:protein lifeguard 1-like [Hyposmocoma kahamanoa]